MEPVKHLKNVIPLHIMPAIIEHYQRQLEEIPRVKTDVKSPVEEYDRFAYVRKRSFYLANEPFQGVIRELLPNHDFLCESFFESRPNQKLVTWHTGITQAMITEGAEMITLWFPLKGISPEDGGLVRFYQGVLADPIADFLHLALKHQAVNLIQYLGSMEHHLERHSFVPDVKAGDCVVFDEKLPHKVETPCKNHRLAYSLRMLPKGFKVDEKWGKSKLGKETSYSVEGLYKIAMGIED